MKLREKLAALEVGKQFVYPRASLNVSMYVSHWGKQHGRKFRTRRVELGRRVERIA